MPVKRTEPTRKSTTNWKAFRSARVKVSEILCKGYVPVHLADLSCHGRCLLTAKALDHHIENGHGSADGNCGFKFTLTPDTSVDPLWQDLENFGMEIHDFRCDVCDKVLPLHNIHIINHMRPHAGKSRRVRPGGAFLMTLSNRPPMPSEEELLDE
jgi:hypothetical protein